ncbi:phage fiber-tail adaptor protein [Oceanibium sediminis]|uniref:phage fiber-tail adaptor protein n=1 Tax=Oceanibium sediminis TaxID=2026339 RepID=UPI000DD30FAC|nr:hypothetical protein [Oceanibium sediminis]
MSGYILKPEAVDAVAQIDWAEGYLEPGEYVDADLGWQVTPASGPGDARIVEQFFDNVHSVARLSGGVPGRIYVVSAGARTNTGRALERALTLRIAA